jgi:hypothetical protein
MSAAGRRNISPKSLGSFSGGRQADLPEFVISRYARFLIEL